MAASQAPWLSSRVGDEEAVIDGLPEAPGDDKEKVAVSRIQAQHGQRYSQSPIDVGGYLVSGVPTHPACKGSNRGVRSRICQLFDNVEEPLGTNVPAVPRNLSGKKLVR